MDLLTELLLLRASSTMQSIQCVIVGDAAVMAKELVTAYTTRNFHKYDIPYVTVMIGREPYTLVLWDESAELEDYNNLRPLSYPAADVFLICFSIVAPDSFENVREKVIIQTMHAHHHPYSLCPYTQHSGTQR